jgi:hypothetical protein
VLSWILLGVKLPVPLLVHLPVLVDPDTVPLTLSDGLFAHNENVAGPAFTNGGLVMVISMVSRSAAQMPLAVEVSTSFTEPAAVSAVLG